MARAYKLSLVSQVLEYLNPQHDGENEIKHLRKNLLRLTARDLEIVLSCLKRMYI